MSLESFEIMLSILCCHIPSVSSVDLILSGVFGENRFCTIVYFVFTKFSFHTLVLGQLSFITLPPVLILEALSWSGCYADRQKKKKFPECFCTKEQHTGWAAHVARIWRIRNANRILFQCLRCRPLEKRKAAREENEYTRHRTGRPTWINSFRISSDDEPSWERFLNSGNVLSSWVTVTV
jgi:hypothetical protein